MKISELIFDLELTMKSVGDVDVTICEDVEYVNTHIAVGNVVVVGIRENYNENCYAVITD